MREAFTYMFKDNCYYKKALVFLLLTFIESACLGFAQMNSCNGMCPLDLSSGIFTPSKTNALIFQLTGLIFNFLVLGYFNTCIEAITKQVNNIILPFFNFINSITKGIKYIIAIAMPIVLYGLLIGILQVINPIVATIATIAVLLFYLIFGVGFVWLFANEKSFFTFFCYRRIINEVKNAPRNYFKNLLFIIITTILIVILNFITEFLFALFKLNPLITMLVTTFVSSIISAYLTFVLVYFIAKSIKTNSVV